MVVVGNLTNTQSKVIPHQHLKQDILDFPTNVSEFNNDAGYIDNTVDDLVNYYKKSETYNQTEVDNAISAAVSAVYRYKASVETLNDLPTTGNVVGDVYDVLTEFDIGDNHYPAGTDVAWTGSGWNPLGGKVDLSNYYNKDEVEDKIEEISYTKSEVNTMTGLNSAEASFDGVTVSEDSATKTLTATDVLDTDIEDAFEKDADSIKQLVRSFNALKDRVDTNETDIGDVETDLTNVYTKSEVNTITGLTDAVAGYSAIDVAINDTTKVATVTDYVDNKNINEAQDKNIEAIKALLNAYNALLARVDALESANASKTKWLEKTFTGSEYTFSDDFITPQSVITPTYSKEPEGHIKLYVDNGSAKIVSSATESNLTVYLCIEKNPLV